MEMIKLDDANMNNLCENSIELILHEKLHISRLIRFNY